MGISGMGSAAVAVALPDLTDDLDVSATHAAWVLSVYPLMVAVSTVAYGRLGDRHGVRAPLALGVVLLVCGGVGGALAPSFGWVLVARLVQGAGAAAAPTLTITALRVLYPVELRVRVLPWAIGTALAVTACGPVLGGALADSLGWRATMLLPVVSLVSLIWLWRLLPHGGSGAAVDLLGASLVSLVAGGVFLVVQSIALGWWSAALGGAVVALAAPACRWWVDRHPSGFLPHAILTEPGVVMPALAASGVAAVWFALLVAVPVMLDAAGWSAVLIGAAVLPGALLGTALSPLVGRRLSTAPPRAALTVGLTVAASALAALAVADVARAPGLVVGASALAYVGYAFAQPAMNVAVSAAVESASDGAATGFATMLFFLAGGMGAAVGGLGPAVGVAWTAVLLLGFPVAGALALRLWVGER